MAYNYQATLREQTGIKTLKVGFNKMFGYYIEVVVARADKMPQAFEEGKKTLVNGERFISPELKEYEEKILTADERIAAHELTLFRELQEKVGACICRCNCNNCKGDKCR